MDNATRNYINKMAEILYKELKLTPNFNIEDVVRQLNGEIVHDDDSDNVEISIDDFDAKISKDNSNEESEFIITISDSKPEVRRRFSIAHELGHLFLHMNFLKEQLWNKNSGVTNSEYYRFGHNAEEREANEFAAAFLMPECEFNKIAEECNYDVNKIANRFGVSSQAAEFRGKNLGVIG